MASASDTVYVVKRGYRWRAWWLAAAGFDFAALLYSQGWWHLYWVAMMIYMLKPARKEAK